MSKPTCTWTYSPCIWESCIMQQAMKDYEQACAEAEQEAINETN